MLVLATSLILLSIIISTVWLTILFKYPQTEYKVPKSNPILWKLDKLPALTEKERKRYLKEALEETKHWSRYKL